MSQGDDIIGSLVEDLTPVRPYPKPWVRAVCWTVVLTVVVFSLMHFWQPFRASFIQDLISAPRYAIELIFGLVLSFVAMYWGFVLAVPGASEASRVKQLAVLIGIMFCAMFAANFFATPLEPSMSGKRYLCFLEVLFYGVLSLVGLLAVLRRSGFNQRSMAGLAAGVGAAFIPYVAMQLSCMYEPGHILAFHFLPSVVVALLAWMLGKWILPKL